MVEGGRTKQTDNSFVRDAENYGTEHHHQGDRKMTNQNPLQVATYLKENLRMVTGYKSMQSGETRPEKSLDLVGPARNHDGITHVKELYTLLKKQTVIDS